MSSPRLVMASRIAAARTECASRPVERCEHAVPGRLHLTPSEPFQLDVHDAIVGRKHLTPMSVAYTRHVVGRVDNVGKHDRGEHAIGVDRCMATSDKVGDRIEQWAGITREKQVILTRKHHRLGVRDVRRHIVDLRMVSARAASPQHERGHTNRREHGAEIRRYVRSQSPIAMLRRGGQVDTTLVPLFEPRIAAKGRRGHPVQGFVARSFQEALNDLGREALRVIVALDKSGRRVEQNQAVDALRMCRREQATPVERAGGETQHDRSFDPHLVE